jgi:hypothetical protein
MYIKASERTPEFNYNSSSGEMIFTGESYPENASNFYKPILEKLESLCQSNTPLILKFELIYLNSSSLGIFRNMMNLLVKYVHEGNSISVIWQYFEDDEGIIEIGQDLHELFPSIDFQFKTITD